MDMEKEKAIYSYPIALAKACEDAFDYCIKLKNGDVIFFGQAEPVSKKWVRLLEVDTEKSIIGSMPKNAVFERGIDIKISSVLWICDAPFGT